MTAVAKRTNVTMRYGISILDVEWLESIGNKKLTRYAKLLRHRLDRCTLAEMAPVFKVTRERLAQMEHMACNYVYHKSPYRRKIKN